MRFRMQDTARERKTVSMQDNGPGAQRRTDPSADREAAAMQRKGHARQDIFEKAPVFEAILKLAIPTMIGQIIMVIYNMADTFFIGQTGSDAMIAAATVAMPAFMFLSAISNLFGVGGASAIARALGRRNSGRARLCSAFSFYGCLIVTVLYAAGVYFFLDGMVSLLGGRDPLVHVFACQYMIITVVIGSIPASMNALLAHLIRSEGRSLHAAVGVSLGGILNMLLDPLFMFVLLPRGQEIRGAAIATTLSNVSSLIYFTVVLVRVRHKTSLSFKWKAEALSDKIPSEILVIGLPACMMTLCENISYAIMDALVAGHGLAYQAGLGVAKKVNMLAHCIVRGISQGVLPLIAYNYAARNYKRMYKSLRASAVLSVVLAGLCMVASLVFSHQLVEIFIRHESPSQDYGATFLSILCIGCPFSALAYMLISFFQAVEKGQQSLLLALLRKGILDIPLLFLLNSLLPPFGLAWATPAADIVCSITAVIFFLHFMKTHIHRDALLDSDEAEILVK